MRARILRRRHSLDIWPGFVDALTSLILVLIFLILLFILGQSVLSDAIASKEGNLQSLQRLLSSERAENSNLQARLTELQDRLNQLMLQKDQLESREISLNKLLEDREHQSIQLEEERTRLLSMQGLDLAEIEKLRTHIESMNLEIKTRDERILTLDQELKLVSETRLSELEKYRSEFFGKLKEALKGQSDLRISGDRFILPSDVLFKSGSADLDPGAEGRLEKLASTLRDIEARIPPKIDWVIRVDGHTDKTPIQSSAFPSNWELSSARAITLVKFLIRRGIDPKHLSANGLGPYHPLDPTDTPSARSRNRRIEFQLTNR